MIQPSVLVLRGPAVLFRYATTASWRANLGGASGRPQVPEVRERQRPT